MVFSISSINALNLMMMALVKFMISDHKSVDTLKLDLKIVSRRRNLQISKEDFILTKEEQKELHSQIVINCIYAIMLLEVLLWLL